MTTASSLEKRLYGRLGWLCLPGINNVGRGVWRVVRPIMPNRYRDYFPVTGEYTCRLPSGNSIKLISPGLDWYAALLHWGGIEEHEPGTIRLLDCLAHDAKVFMDIGANIGAMGLFIAKDHPDVEVYAFEPVPHVYETLARHRDLNQATNLHVFNLALSDKPGRLPLYIPNARWNTARDASLSADYQRDCRTVEVDVSTIDRFAAEHQVEAIDLLKIDAETHEPAILEGAAAVIDRDRPFIICEALPGRTEQGLNTVMAHRDYRFFHILDDQLVERARPGEGANREAWNFLFAPAERFALLQQLLGSRLTLTELS